jgi:hypothetical protein
MPLCVALQYAGSVPPAALHECMFTSLSMRVPFASPTDASLWLIKKPARVFPKSVELICSVNEVVAPTVAVNAVGAAALVLSVVPLISALCVPPGVNGLPPLVGAV